MLSSVARHYSHEAASYRVVTPATVSLIPLTSQNHPLKLGQNNDRVTDSNILKPGIQFHKAHVAASSPHRRHLTSHPIRRILTIKLHGDELSGGLSAVEHMSYRGGAQLQVSFAGLVESAVCIGSEVVYSLQDNAGLAAGFRLLNGIRRYLEQMLAC